MRMSYRKHVRNVDRTLSEKQVTTVQSILPEDFPEKPEIDNKPDTWRNIHDIFFEMVVPGAREG